ncbi:hypothetical protein BU15DRAFT_68637 [Melanogaster broomeanus]|nr:hypothetical protein BU15DRAFT_68637 [Melanogaster broomeanus]
MSVYLGSVLKSGWRARIENRVTDLAFYFSLIDLVGAMPKTSSAQHSPILTSRYLVPVAVEKSDRKFIINMTGSGIADIANDHRTVYDVVWTGAIQEIEPLRRSKWWWSYGRIVRGSSEKRDSIVGDGGDLFAQEY